MLKVYKNINPKIQNLFLSGLISKIEKLVLECFSNKIIHHFDTDLNYFSSGVHTDNLPHDLNESDFITICENLKNKNLLDYKGIFDGLVVAYLDQQFLTEFDKY